MAIICTPSPFPNYRDLRNQVIGLFPSTPIAFPGISVTMPTMPTMPSAVWPSALHPGAYLEMFANEFQTFQLLTVMGVAYEVLSSIISIPLPSIPGLPGINLTTLLGNNPALILTQLTNLPLNLFGAYPSLVWPEMQNLTFLQFVVGNYLAVMINFLFELVNSVADNLQVTKLQALPAIPTIPDISNLVRLGNFSFPGFAIDLSFPDPLIPGMTFPEYEVEQLVKMLSSSLPTANMQSIVSFITEKLNLSLPLPRICLPLTFPTG